MPIILKILLIIGVVLQSSCMVQEKYWGKVSPVFITEEMKQHIKSTKVIVSLDQDSKLGVPISGQRTSHQYHGVIGKLAESAMVRFESDLSEDRRRLLRGVDRAAFNFDINVKFSEAVEKILRPITWLHVNTVGSQYDAQISEIESWVKTQDEDTLLLIDNRYLMAIDFSSITVFSYVTLYAREETLVKIAKANKPYENPPTLYKNLFTYEFRYEGNYTTALDALKGWSKDEGFMVKRALSESITDLTEQMVADLSYVTSSSK